MKKLLIYLMLFSAAACSEDKTEDPARENTPLEVTLNSTSLCMGEVMTATIRIADTEEGEALRQTDFPIYFEAIENGAYTDLFANFTSETIFPKGSEEITVQFPVRESGIDGEHTVLFWVSAEGRAITGASQTITISDHHYITVSVKDSETNDVTEGTEFVLQAEIAEPAPEALTITILPEEGASEAFENLPATMTIPQGETVTMCDPVTVKRDDGGKYDDRDWNFTGAAANNKYAVKAFKITRIDSDVQKGDRLLDEKWVYDNPDAAFYSTVTEALYLACPSYKEGDILMEKSVKAGEGDVHPNRTLAAEGWTLLQALEFHALNGWSYSRSVQNSYGNYPVAVANGWGAQETQKVEETCFVDNAKYTTVTDDGYLRMWAAKDNGNAHYAGGGARAFGAAALYANKIGMNTAVPQNTVIREGTRIEVRARLRGRLQGFNYAIWLMGNSNNVATDWPQCGEIDIMENPVFVNNVAGSLKTVHQTLHYGTPIGDVHANPTVNKTIEPSEWNIYWVEIVDATTIKAGINGVTTKTFTASDNAYEWAFTNEKNPNGFHILLTPGLAAEWPCGALTDEQIKSGSWADPAFLNLTYEQSRTSDLAPRMEVDWIRYWKNENYNTDGAAGVNTAGKFF